MHSQSDCKPPNYPWVRLEGSEVSGSYLAFYYSDPYSEVPVRRISSEIDSKSDPNLETMTFGLFSTCERQMRTQIVKRGMRYLFFCTRRRVSRVLVGYYELGWYAVGPLIKGYSRMGKRVEDYILAANSMRFVNPGFVLKDLTGYLEGVDLSSKFRINMKIDQKTSDKLLSLLNETKDNTPEYMSEIVKLENENLGKVGYKYPNWKKKTSFSWADARKYLGLGVSE